MKNIEYEYTNGTQTKDTRASSVNYKNTTSFTSENAPKWSEAIGQESKKMTLMIYMVGSNLESRGSAASIDLIEIANSGLATKDVNLVLCCGGSSKWALPLNSDALNYLVYQDRDFISYSSDKASLGESSTLSGFINSTVEKFPDEHYGIICWEHGAGPVMGYGMDETSPSEDGTGGDLLSIEEITAVLDSTVFKNRKLDFIGFDACLMSSIEIACALELYANKLIASAETEPGCGWDYGFLKDLNDAADLSSIDSSIIDYYYFFLFNNRRFDFNPDYVLCSLDLTKTAEALEKTNSLFKAMHADLESGGIELLELRENVHEYAADAYYDLVDIAHLAELMSEAHPEKSEALFEALNSFVISGRTNIKESGGVSIYFPYINATMLMDYGGEGIISAQSALPDYVEFMRNFIGYILTGAPSMEYDNIKLTMPAEGKANDGYATYTLSDEELADFSHAYYTVFTVIMDNNGKTVCMPIIEDIPVAVNSRSEIKLDLDPMVAITNTDKGESLAGQFRVVQASGDTVDLVSVNSFLSESMQFDMDGWDMSAFGINIRANKASDDVYIKSITSPYDYDGKITLSGKQDISSDGMHCLGFFTIDSHTFTEDNLNTPL